MRHKLIYSLLTLSVLFFACTAALGAGNKVRKEKAEFTIKVMSEDGTPLGYSTVSSSRNRHIYLTDGEGRLTEMFSRTDILKVSAAGYETRVTELSNVESRIVKVTLADCPLYEDDGHILHTVDGGTISELRTVGNYAVVKGSELEEYPSLTVMDALSGRLNGLFFRKTNTVPATNAWSGFVRAANGGTPVIMVDGVVRSLDYIEPETIESVEILKDASLKALYGGVRTNAIILVTTKRGKAYENGVRVNIQSGVEVPTVIPGYLNAKDYTTAYNQAMVNSEMTPFYDPSKYDGFSSYEYPDVDFQKYFLKSHMNITRANAQMTGGSRNTKYFLNLGFQNEKGLERFTSNPQSDRTFTVRGNVDNTIFDFITFKVGVNAALQTRKWYNYTADAFISLLTDIRPNEFPIQIPGEVVGKDEEYVLGGIPTRRMNPLGVLTKNGFVEREFSYIQSDFSILFDFNRWIQGLSISPSVTFDVYNMYSSRKDGGFSVWQPTSFDEDGAITGAQNWGYDNVVTNLVTGDVGGRRNWHFRTTADYDRTFNDVHRLKAVLMYFMQRQDFSSSIHSIRRVNVAAQANYMFDNRYILDFSGNYVGLPSFARNHRFGLFPTVGFGWVISNENFMKNMLFVDYLKFHASYGVLGSTNYNSDGLVANYYYKTLYGIGSSYGQFTSFNNIAEAIQIGNPDITFQKSKEFNYGIDFSFLDNTLHGSVGGFLNDFTGGIANLADVTPGVVGSVASLAYNNLKSQRSYGAEAELAFTKRFGNVEINLGGNVTWSRSTMTKDYDVNYPDGLAGFRKVRLNGDVLGYRVIGVFADQADIDASPVQPFEGKVYSGDLKYEDSNNDGYIDKADRTVIANTTPSVQYGVNVSVRYKGLNLDVLGYGLAGFDTMLTNKYYQIYGSRKYSDVLNTGLPNGNAHPKIHADMSLNNFQDSDYWVVKGGFFKIRNVELGYTLPIGLTSKVRINGVKIFVRCTNLFTVSRINDLDPEYIDGGVTNYPLMKAFTGGISFSF